MGRRNRQLHEIESLVDYLVRTGTGSGLAADLRWGEVLRILAGRPMSAVVPVLEARFATLVDWLWANGWLPGEVIRQVRRDGSAANRALMAAAVAADHRGRDPTTLHPRWLAHIDGLDLPSVPQSGWLTAAPVMESAGGSPSELLATAIETVILADLGVSLRSTVPPPGSTFDPSSVATDATNDPVLEKIRQLLAQAESTSYDAEAEAFTAKAHELMARHALDAAEVWSRSRSGESPVTVRVTIDDPYVDAKSLLLQVVAESFRCRAVYHSRFAFSTLVGFGSDLVSAETLYTSLLIQAQQALGRAANVAPPGARTRSRRYRSSFLQSYAVRIGERLNEINDRVQAESDTEDGSLLPVLARRNSAVEETMSELFPEVTSSVVRGGYDWMGYSDGRSAAEHADLNRPVERGARAKAAATVLGR